MALFIPYLLVVTITIYQFSHDFCLSGSDVNYINKSGQHSLLAAVTSRCNFEVK